MSGLEAAKETHSGKVKRRKAQLHESELEVKTLREKLVEIQKRITPELLKNLNKQLDKSDNEGSNLHVMLRSFASLINMRNVSSSNEIREDFKEHSHLIEKMINAMATNFLVNNDIVEKHRESLKDVQKSFTD